MQIRAVSGVHRAITGPNFRPTRGENDHQDESEDESGEGPIRGAVLVIAD